MKTPDEFLSILGAVHKGHGAGAGNLGSLKEAGGLFAGSFSCRCRPVSFAASQPMAKPRKVESTRP